MCFSKVGPGTHLIVSVESSISPASWMMCLTFREIHHTNWSNQFCKPKCTENWRYMQFNIKKPTSCDRVDMYLRNLPSQTPLKGFPWAVKNSLHEVFKYYVSVYDMTIMRQKVPILTHYDLLTPYDVIGLGPFWTRGVLQYNVGVLPVCGYQC